jgi:lipopolysaccharide biosynthesis glycosyltransferase
MLEPIRLFVGLDPNAEPVAYHAFCQSVIEHSSVPVSFTPLCLHNLKGYEETHKDGSNAFIYSRFLVPSLCGYQGWAIFADGDMLCRSDIAELIAMRDEYKAVMVAKHDYKSKHPIKYLGAKNDDYPRKNWSSVILWNCGHHQNKKLTPEYVMQATGKQLHRFEHLEDRFIGEIPLEWNWLVNEYEYSPDAKLVHYTIGTPCFEGYQEGDYAQEWWDTYARAIFPLHVSRRTQL